MKKFMTLMLGLSLLSGMAVFAQDKNTTDTMKSTKKTKKSKKKSSTTSTTSSVH